MGIVTLTQPTTFLIVSGFISEKHDLIQGSHKYSDCVGKRFGEGLGQGRDNTMFLT